jgi:hypothetical protein
MPCPTTKTFLPTETQPIAPSKTTAPAPAGGVCPVGATVGPFFHAKPASGGCDRSDGAPSTQQPKRPKNVLDARRRRHRIANNDTNAKAILFGTGNIDAIRYGMYLHYDGMRLVFPGPVYVRGWCRDSDQHSSLVHRGSAESAGRWLNRQGLMAGHHLPENRSVAHNAAS